MIDLLLTVKASVTSGTLAEVATIRIISTAPPVETRTICTSHGTELTVFAIVPRRTGAGVGIFQVLEDNVKLIKGQQQNKTSVSVSVP